MDPDSDLNPGRIVAAVAAADQHSGMDSRHTGSLSYIDLLHFRIPCDYCWDTAAESAECIGPGR